MSRPCLHVPIGGLLVRLYPFISPRAEFNRVASLSSTIQNGPNRFDLRVCCRHPICLEATRKFFSCVQHHPRHTAASPAAVDIAHRTGRHKPVDGDPYCTRRNNHFDFGTFHRFTSCWCQVSPSTRWWWKRVVHDRLHNRRRVGRVRARTTTPPPPAPTTSAPSPWASPTHDLQRQRRVIRRG